MSRWLGRNVSLVVISVLLAFFFWAVATEAENPTVQKAFSGTLPLAIEHKPDDMVIYNQDTLRVRVELRAPQSVWTLLTGEDIHTYVDLSTAATGTITLPVQVDVRQQPVRVVGVSPAYITLNFEPLTYKEFPVTVKVKGTPTLGYKAEAPVVAPQVVRVQGPASLVGQVALAQVVVEIDEKQSDVIGDYELLLLDAEDNPVANVETAPKTVTVNVPVTQLSYIRDLAVTVSLEGQPAPGYRIAKLEVIPPIVKVIGSSAAVRNAPGFLQTLPINMDGITQSLTTTVGLQLMEGLSVITPPRPYVTASLHIEAVQSGLKLDVKPEVTGLHDPYTVTVGIESVVVILNGPLAIMETLPITDVRLTLDLTNLTPGDYNLIPVVKVPDGVRVQNLLPETVPVKITALSPRLTPGEEGR
ncbi:MAG: hypothetical protein JXA21_06955 [Anaerolineae bacterium]|nr:hypothetical protein [Anaerolineae bacterium]